MGYVVVEFPVEGGGVLRIQETEESLPNGLEPAARPGRKGPPVLRAKESLQATLEEIKPAVDAIATQLRAMAADEISLEFGLMLGIEGGAIVAKGTAEVHFAVTITWQKSARGHNTGEPASDA